MRDYLDTKSTKYITLFKKMLKTSSTPTPAPLTIENNKHQYKKNIRVGSLVLIVQKKHQKTGELTRGKVLQFLTHKAFHPRGIKVIITGGYIGRVQKILVY